MSESNKGSLRIDWFDGTLIEDARPNTSTSAEFADEEQPELKKPDKPQYTEKKPIGFKRLLDISMLKPPILNLEVSHRPGFWNLLDEKELKGDFIVLIVKILASIYKCLEPGENSKIVKMLRTRFQNSNFLVNLKNYLDELPSVRIAEKRLNSHLWDDAESFFNNVIDLCEGIISFDVSDTEFLKEILDLIEITEISAIGVREEHTERFSDEMFIRIETIKLEAMSLLKDLADGDVTSGPTEERNKDIHYFKNLNIFPTKDDLLYENKIPIQPNIINGAYPNVEHYLDIQFKLLREDCFGPLREGICKYLQNPSKRRHENIRVYPKVRILRNYVSNNKVGHLVDIAYKERINHGVIDNKRYTYNKQLMFGSLLLFTCDNFDTILCATVLDCNYNLLNEGYVAVSFQNPTSKKIFTESYLMVESEVFFEPYHRVLKVLQESRIDDLPMKKYIVDVQKDTKAPSYLNEETIYTLPYKDEEMAFPVLDTEQWPENFFELDSSQMEAYKFALTREFAVIQGPPGTGKTFIGVKIANTLLRNLSLEGTPMLVICYTNHALDQFLEGILNITNSIVRLGSQSKSAALEKYTLNNLRMKVKSKYSYLYGKKRSELETIFKQMTEVQGEIEKCEKEIVSYKNLKPYLKIGTKNYELKSTKEDSVLSWLFSHLEEDFDVEEETEEEDWEKFGETPSEDIETCFSEAWALKEIDSMLNSIKYVKDVTDDETQREEMTEKLEKQINRVRRRINCFKKYRTLQNDNQELKIVQLKDLYSLNTEQKWQLYYNAVGAIKSELMVKMYTLLDQHNTANQELEEVSTSIDGDVMRSVRVVGVTTTTAARRHDLLRKLLSPIVIVEEAAEVLEAHIISSLTHHCQHLILIGDHKQLRPTAAHYKLARDYNLEISLFERMIRNGVHARTLSTQRRMRPNFVPLIVPAIYDRLDCHPSVLEYPDVKGMKDNLYFYTHDAFEDSEASKEPDENTLEADNGNKPNNGFKPKPYWNSTLSDLVAQRRLALKNFRRNPIPDNLTILELKTKESRKAIRKAKLLYQGMEDSWSHKNTVEAKWCVALANYLRQMKYSPDEITILSTYTGQVSLIKDLRKKYPLLRDVKITAVDNYQGEENRVIILSLVRSNKDNRIGFLTAPNRICVALSRAKEGFYIFGNMDVLKSASNIWKRINDKLSEQNAIGKTLTLRCETHKENYLDIQNIDDFENCISGSCLRNCKIK